MCLAVRLSRTAVWVLGIIGIGGLEGWLVVVECGLVGLVTLRGGNAQKLGMGEEKIKGREAEEKSKFTHRRPHHRHLRSLTFFPFLRLCFVSTSNRKLKVRKMFGQGYSLGDGAKPSWSVRVSRLDASGFGPNS